MTSWRFVTCSKGFTSKETQRLGAEIYENALKGNLQKTITFSKEDEVMLKRRIVALKVCYQQS